MATYRTPGVYIEEISVFPPSVAEVETAIPAFVGYTEKATRIVPRDLKNLPTRIGSLLEFEFLFGKGPKIKVDEVVIDEANNFVSASISNSYYLYDSLRLFFDNGGGNCYIVSVGNYSEKVACEALKEGVKTLKQYDEPTILLFPDAVTQSPDDLATVQQAALKQCGELGDRVAVLDIRRGDERGESFREKLGVENLKYGAAYTPWLHVNYSKNVGYAEIKNAIKRGTVPVQLEGVTADAGLLKLIADAKTAADPVTAAAAAAAAKAKAAAAKAKADDAKAKAGDAKVKADDAKVKADDAKAKADDAKAKAAAAEPVQAAADTALAAAATAQAAADAAQATAAAAQAAADAAQAAAAAEPDNAEKAAAATAAQTIADTVKTAADTAKTTADAAQADADAAQAAAAAAQAAADTAQAAADAAQTAAGTAQTVADSAQAAAAAAQAAAEAAQAAAEDAQAAADAAIAEQRLLANFGLYRNLINGINSTPTFCPPSGAIAGVYARVDGQRGVWKAPANVSLNSVIAPTVHFDLSETNGLNVDAVAGKSINAIRFFSGKGTLVWGARTLAGNDNEWRYVSVRRFFNMVEESVKKSTYWAVFEPNDANTWVKVRGMIENYLTQKWREGALAGATTKEAFFVRCGLGVTMNAQDILEGRLIVELGLAVVRPAEFIILKFSHKLQTS